MADGEFRYEDCLMKHYVRVNLWLPACKDQLKRVRDSQRGTRKSFRRMRYFTFCAASALDVMMLNHAKIIPQSKAEGFSSVVFFDHNPEAVVATQETVPGAIGFPGDFAKLIAGNHLDIGIGEGALDPIADKKDVRQTHEEQKANNIRFQFQSRFPFDVINLDVEGYLFKPTEELPGRMVDALRNILRWQTRRSRDEENREFQISNFVLFFTTKLGPDDITQEQRDRLADSLTRNLAQYPEIKAPYNKRANGLDPKSFLANDFASAFKLTIPKMLADLIYEFDWYSDPDFGLRVLEFSRPHADGTYTMLHMAMLIHRKDPPMERRIPGDGVSSDIHNAQVSIIQKLFENEVLDVEQLIKPETVSNQLRSNLEKIVLHRAKLKSAAAGN